MREGNRVKIVVTGVIGVNSLGSEMTSCLTLSHDEHTHHTQLTVTVVLSVSALLTVKETVVCVPVRNVLGLTASVDLLGKSAVL